MIRIRGNVILALKSFECGWQIYLKWRVCQILLNVLSGSHLSQAAIFDEIGQFTSKIKNPFLLPPSMCQASVDTWQWWLPFWRVLADTISITVLVDIFTITETTSPRKQTWEGMLCIMPTNTTRVCHEHAHLSVPTFLGLSSLFTLGLCKSSVSNPVPCI